MSFREPLNALRISTGVNSFRFHCWRPLSLEEDGREEGERSTTAESVGQAEEDGVRGAAVSVYGRPTPLGVRVGDVDTGLEPRITR